MKTKVLVCGAGGFIAGHLVEKLVEEKFWVCGVDYKAHESRVSLAHIFVVGNLTDQQFVNTLFADHHFDHVYQLAADMGGATYINSGFHDGDVMSNSVLINVNVAKACVKHGVKRLFFPSSACVYPASKDVATCKEEDVYPAFPDNNYGWEKLYSERMYKSFEKQYGLVVRIARFHSIVGEFSTWCGGKEKAHSALARKVAEIDRDGEIEVIGDGEQRRTFLHVKDCVRGVRMLMDSEVGEIVNIGSDEEVSINEYIRLLAKISNKVVRIRYIDGPTGVLTRKCDISKAKALLGWQPTITLDEATRRTYEWINQQMHQLENVLFVCQKIGYDVTQTTHCGIGIKAKLTSDILKKSTKYNFIQLFIDQQNELEDAILKFKPKIVIYSFHSHTTSWLINPALRLKYNHIKHIMVHYDFNQQLIDTFTPEGQHYFDGVITDDPTLRGTEKVYIVSRSLPASDFKSLPVTTLLTGDDLPVNKVVKIGFQGFGPAHKGIHRIAAQAQYEFDECIIRLHIPFSHFGDPYGTIARQRVEEVKSIITKPGIQVEASHQFLTDEEIVQWLHENDVNCYFYDYLDGCGIASSPDYALAARKPIAVTKSHQLRNFWSLTPSVIIGENSLKDIIANGTLPLEVLYNKYTHANVVRDYERIVDYLL